MSSAITKLIMFMIVGTIALIGGGKASATLIKQDFQTPGDGFLILDDTTNTEWLTPFYTRNLSVNQINSGIFDLTTTHGFQYASTSQVLNMINNNFGNPPFGFSNGNASGFTAAGQFLDIFGITWNINCSGSQPGAVPCPRTQGITSDFGGGGISPNSRQAVGMIQFGSIGYGLLNTNGILLDTNQLQLGHWLIRDAAVNAVPIPSTLLFFGLGFAGFVVWRYRMERLI